MTNGARHSRPNVSLPPLLQKLSMWESRERRKGKECEKDYEKETSKKEEQVSS